MFHYVSNKAGMNGMDKDEIQRRIMEISKGSAYYQRELERTQAADQKASEYQKKIESHRRN